MPERWGSLDADGSASYNQSLSEARALAIRNYLVQLASLSGVKINSVGMGESEPVASNNNDAGRRMNRRVEIIGID
jgi:OOP family OmpA-OmpF porin